MGAYSTRRRLPHTLPARARARAAAAAAAPAPASTSRLDDAGAVDVGMGAPVSGGEAAASGDEAEAEAEAGAALSARPKVRVVPNAWDVAVRHAASDVEGVEVAVADDDEALSIFFQYSARRVGSEEE
jgi:hypothetical protein